jgi:hypothetical protein
MMETLICALVATALVDLWSLLRLRLLGTPLPNYAMVGRWLAHIPRGRLRHDAIAKSAAIRGELLIGWLTHYLIGVAFAAAFLVLAGRGWVAAPAPLPALLFGVVTVAAPWFVMQPAMGAGIAANRTPRPGAARLQSLVTHAIFGLGLYAGGLVVHSILKGV